MDLAESMISAQIKADMKQATLAASAGGEPTLDDEIEKAERLRRPELGESAGTSAGRKGLVVMKRDMRFSKGPQVAKAGENSPDATTSSDPESAAAEEAKKADAEAAKVEQASTEAKAKAPQPDKVKRQNDAETPRKAKPHSEAKAKPAAHPKEKAAKASEEPAPHRKQGAAARQQEIEKQVESVADMQKEIQQELGTSPSPAAVQSEDPLSQAIEQIGVVRAQNGDPLPFETLVQVEESFPLPGKGKVGGAVPVPAPGVGNAADRALPPTVNAPPSPPAPPVKSVQKKIAGQLPLGRATPKVAATDKGSIEAALSSIPSNPLAPKLETNATKQILNDYNSANFTAAQVENEMDVLHKYPLTEDEVQAIARHENTSALSVPWEKRNFVKQNVTVTAVVDVETTDKPAGTETAAPVPAPYVAPPAPPAEPGTDVTELGDVDTNSEGQMVRAVPTAAPTKAPTPPPTPEPIPANPNGGAGPPIDPSHPTESLGAAAPSNSTSEPGDPPSNDEAGNITMGEDNSTSIVGPNDRINHETEGPPSESNGTSTDSKYDNGKGEHTNPTVGELLEALF
jgi:hypothetical protein